MTKSQFTPAKGYILIEPIDQQKVGNIEIADDGLPQNGKVLAIGQATYHDNGKAFEPPCKVGDIIVHSAGGFENMRVEGKIYRFVHFSKVLAIQNA